jgi:hypothetical protein
MTRQRTDLLPKNFDYGQNRHFLSIAVNFAAM